MGGRPVSGLTTKLLAWVWRGLLKDGKHARRVVWDKASWQLAQAVRSWRRAPKRNAKQEGGGSILGCQLPTKSPWLKRIEPHWVHGKRAGVAPGRTLTAAELISRICDYYRGQQLRQLSK